MIEINKLEEVDDTAKISKLNYMKKYIRYKILKYTADKIFSLFLFNEYKKLK